jgi:hypothetical protein
MVKKYMGKIARGLAKVAIGSGILTLADFLGFGEGPAGNIAGINHPYANIAIGSGLAAGWCIEENDTGGVAVSLIGLFGSTLPYVSISQQTGNYFYLGAKITMKILQYCTGVVLGYAAKNYYSMEAEKIGRKAKPATP